jgi:hypothetical protein
MKSTRIFAACALVLAAMSAAAEPLAEFEQIVARCRAAVADPFVQVVQAPQGAQWVKRAFWPAAAVEFDVVKSTSLVAPVTAWISFGVGIAAGRADTREAADALPLAQDQPQFTRQIVRLQFAHKAGVWEPVGGTYAYSMRTRAGEAFSAPSSIEVKREAFVDPLSMAGRCVLARAQ